MPLMKRGRLTRVKNLDKKVGANAFYWQVLVCVDGELQTLLLTDEQLQVAKERTTNNPEDEVKPTWLDKII